MHIFYARFYVAVLRAERCLFSETGYGVGVSTGAIVGIVILIILIILVLVDVTCYYVNHCGVPMCICVNMCGKESPDAKNKEIHMEEGHTRK